MEINMGKLCGEDILIITNSDNLMEIKIKLR